MAIVAEVTRFVVLALCLYVSPVDSNFEVRIDAIEDGTIEILAVMHESEGSKLICYEVKEDEKYHPLFQAQSDGFKYLFSLEGSPEKVPVDLKKFISLKDRQTLEKLKSGELSDIRIPLAGQQEVHLFKSGSVLYVQFPQFEGVLFLIHE